VNDRAREGNGGIAHASRFEPKFLPRKKKREGGEEENVLIDFTSNRTLGRRRRRKAMLAVKKRGVTGARQHCKFFLTMLSDRIGGEGEAPRARRSDASLPPRTADLHIQLATGEGERKITNLGAGRRRRRENLRKGRDLHDLAPMKKGRKKTSLGGTSGHSTFS